MKKTLILTAIILFVYSCKKEESKNYMVLNGVIENRKSDSLNILNKDRTIFKTIKFSKNNTFTDTIQKPNGYYYLSYENRFAQVYLKSEYDLKLSFDGKSFEKPIEFEGKGANENNYLAQKAQFQNNLGEKSDFRYLLRLDEEQFLKLADSLTQLNIDFLAKFEGLDNVFFSLEQYSNNFDKINRLRAYKNAIERSSTVVLSKNYPNPYQTVNFNNEELLKPPGFLFLVESYCADKTSEKIIAGSSLDYFTLQLETLDEEVKNEQIKQEVAYHIAYNRMVFSQDRERFYQKYLEISVNEEYKKKIAEKYQPFKKIAKGVISSGFELFDSNDKLVSLNDLKGKPVYIDIWATWCGPCIKEFPALKELEKKFKEIQFVSICKSSEKEKWVKMLTQKELSGIQLFAPDDDIPFFRDFMVNLPWFILLDKDGKIIDSNAKRPSDHRLTEQLESLL